MYTYQIIMWYTLNLFNVIWQLYLNKTGKKKEIWRWNLNLQVSAVPLWPAFPKAVGLACPGSRWGQELRKMQEATTFHFVRCPETDLAFCLCTHRVYFNDFVFHEFLLNSRKWHRSFWNNSAILYPHLYNALCAESWTWGGQRWSNQMLISLFSDLNVSCPSNEILKTLYLMFTYHPLKKLDFPKIRFFSPVWVSNLFNFWGKGLCDIKNPD